MVNESTKNLYITVTTVCFIEGGIPQTLIGRKVTLYLNGVRQTCLNNLVGYTNCI